MNGQNINFDPAKFVPDYFTLNGLSGPFASHPPHHMEEPGFEEHYRQREVIVPAAFIGQPILIRIVNAGVASHSAHIHGNHVFVTAVNGVVQSNVIFVDTFSIQPLESAFQGSLPAPGASQASPIFSGGSRVDWLLPVISPPDIPGRGP